MTVRRSLISVGFVVRFAARKPLLRTANVKKRFAFAKEHEK